MSLLIRKVEISKWKQNDIINGADISADAITGCLRTNNNTLSLWKVDNEQNLDEAVLALVSGAEHLDTIDIIRIDPILLSEKELKISKTPGRTPFKQYIENHIDITELTYKTLGSVASIITQCFIENKEKRYTRGDLKKIIKSGIDQGKIKKEDLNPKMLEKIIQP